MKRPAFQFYPADWRKDAAVQACSMAARGLWHEMLCIAHECEPYGHVTVNGAAMTPNQLARLVGESVRDVGAWLAELEAAGVFSRDADGRIYSRRMVKDERLRNLRADAGRLGGNPNLVGWKVNQNTNHPPNQDGNQGGKQSQTPSSSSSSSSSTSEEKREARASDPPPADDPPPEACGAAAAAMREAGIAAANPQHPLLRRLVAEGVTPAEFRVGAEDAKARGKLGFAYALAVVQGRREDAARAPAVAGKRKPPEPSLAELERQVFGDSPRTIEAGVSA